MWKAEVYVTLKDGVLDPQGTTVQRVLSANGFDNLRDVRVGKYMEVLLEASSEGRARNQVEEMCRKLLANPVIENYRFDIAKVETGGADSQ